MERLRRHFAPTVSRALARSLSATRCFLQPTRFRSSQSSRARLTSSLRRRKPATQSRPRQRFWGSRPRPHTVAAASTPRHAHGRDLPRTTLDRAAPLGRPAQGAHGRVRLEVGGGGSIGRWLADTVGRDGRVVVTDIDPRWLNADRPNMELRRHDIVEDELDRETFDLAHERLVLLHLPARYTALERMIGALKPGGWLLLEDFDFTWLPFAPACGPEDASLFTKVIKAFHDVLGESDVDLAYGRHLYSRLRTAGLVDVHVEAHVQISAGGSPGCRLQRANIEQLREHLVRRELLDDQDIGRVCKLLDDPAFSVNSYPLISARGRRPW